MENQNEYKYRRAKEKVDALKGFHKNLLTYCIVIPFLAYINYRTTSFTWVIFPAVGWGFGLLMHWMHVTGYNPFFGKDWEKRKIQEFMDNDKF
ncbi:2TM domain-containing protein [Flagellimonas sp.]|uniref:2TM domain-containing protein n=1 Tax=Flagellimonas sp. TaxID=2058762 RepID=UPI003B5B9D46